LTPQPESATRERIKRPSSLLAKTGSDGTKTSTSILICFYLQEIGVKKILAKDLDENHAKILRRVGATEVIHPEKDPAIRVSRALSRPNMVDFIPLADEFDLVQVEMKSNRSGLPQKF
jgi:Trk K+ transport system NAD-binding subunit